jgi:hypothetical protein
VSPMRNQAIVNYFVQYQEHTNFAYSASAPMHSKRCTWSQLADLPSNSTTCAYIINLMVAHTAWK